MDVFEHSLSTMFERERTLVDGLLLPCKQGVGGSSPPVGSVSSQVRSTFRGASDFSGV